MKNAHLIPAILLFLLLACAESPPVAPFAAALAAPSAVMPSAAPVARLEISAGENLEFHLAVGPPNATLAVWVLDPDKGTPVKGTVLFLHGFMGTHLQIENAAEALRGAGYRAVLPDLRGFGDSTGDQLTFGVQDASDLTKLTDYLQQHHLCGDSIGVYGTSYGAASAIMYAAADPRVKTLIAVAPFATIREEVPSFSRHVLRGAGSYLSDASLNALADVAADVVHLDLDTARPLDAIQKTAASILLIHGDSDTVVPHAASEQLHAANPKSQLLTIAHSGHLDLCFDIPGRLQETTRNWFDAHMTSP